MNEETKLIEWIDEGMEVYLGLLPEKEKEQLKTYLSVLGPAQLFSYKLEVLSKLLATMSNTTKKKVNP